MNSGPARMPFRLTVAVVIIGLLTPALAQERVVVDISDEPLGLVADGATSAFNFGNSMRVVGMEEEFAAIRVSSLRFPPGNQADEIELSEHDLAALELNLDLLERPSLLIVANLFEGSPEQAADLARLIESMGIEILAWEIGNEPDLYASNRSDPSWTPQRYCAEFREFAAALREVDPGYLMAGPAVSGSRPGGEEYLRAVLRLCGDAIDILTWHIYPTDGTWSDEDALATSSQFSEEIRRYRSWAADPERNPLGFERSYRVGVSEFGLSWRSSSFRHLEDMTAALWLADVLGQMSREGLDYGHYFTLQAMGGHGLIDVGGWVRPTYYVYRMLARFTGQVLPAGSSGQVAAYAVQESGTVRLLLVNPDEREFGLELRAPGFDFAGEPGTVTILDGPTFDETGAPRTGSLAVTSVGTSADQAFAPLLTAAGEPLMVPPRSVVLIELQAGEE